MVLLLDTHILLWALDSPRRLPRDIVAQIASAETTVSQRREYLGDCYQNRPGEN